MLLVFVPSVASVAVSVALPAVLRVTLKVFVPETSGAFAGPERHAKDTAAGGERRVGRQARIGVAGCYANSVIGTGDIPIRVHRVDGDIKGGAGGLGSGRPGFAGGTAWGRYFTRNEQ